MGSRESGACLLSRHWRQNKQFVGRGVGAKVERSLNVGGGG